MQRQRLHEEALEHLVEALAEHEPPDPAGARIARLLLRMEPTHEVACRFLMRTQYLRGNVAAALSVYNDLWERLDREFDALPSDETQRLIVAIKQNEPGAAPSEAEPPAPPLPPTGPPARPELRNIAAHDLAEFQGVRLPATAGFAGIDPGSGCARATMGTSGSWSSIRNAITGERDACRASYPQVG